MSLSLRGRLAIPLLTLGTRIAGPDKTALATVTAKVDDSAGWLSLTGRQQDRTFSEIQELYTDALTAWRKNPMAKRVISITSEFVLGDGITLSSPFAPLENFIQSFWHHPQNHMDLRLDEMLDELSRAGDIFPVLFRNKQNGMSYIRFVTKDQIEQIITAKNDWETITTIIEVIPDTMQRRYWRTPHHPRAANTDAIMLHYAINRPLGALMGESDLATMIPWLLRYSRLLEDRVRTHAAARSFLWFVTVPSNRVLEKQEQYRQPPIPGSIVVKDEAETWNQISPNIRGWEASADLTAIRRMVDAGKGYPPHWRGEPENANLATAEAMQLPAERSLQRRQLYFFHVLRDIVVNAYQRAGLTDLPHHNLNQLIQITSPDLSPKDNQTIATAAQQLASAFRIMVLETGSQSQDLINLFIRQLYHALDETPTTKQIDTITSDLLRNIERTESEA